MKETYDTLPPIKYDANLAMIAKLGEKYMKLVITDLEDADQFEAVHKARMVVVKVRTTTEKAKLAQSARARAYAKDVNAAAQVLFDATEPIETHLQTEENKVTDERKRVKEEEEKKFALLVNGRVEALMTYNVVLPYADVAGMTDDKFDAELRYAQDEFEAEETRKDEEAARFAAERAENVRIRAEQDKKDKEQADKEEALKKDREAFETEKREAKEKTDREAFEKKAKEDAKIKAEQDAKDEAARKEKEDEEAKAENKRQEALLPDRGKLFAFGGLIHSLAAEKSTVSSEEAKDIYGKAVDSLTDIAHIVIEKAEAM